MTGVAALVFGLALLAGSVWLWGRRDRPQTRRNMRAGGSSGDTSLSTGPVSGRQAAAIPVAAGLVALLCIVYGIATL